jgi:predicted permease
VTPKWVHALLRRASGRQTIEDVLGDLEEAHRRRLGRHARFVATVMRGVEVLELSFVLLRERLRQRGGWGERVDGAPWGQDAVSEKHSAGERLHGRVRLGISWLDVKLGVRMLVKYPGLTVVGSLAISVAIGLGAAYFELANDWTNPRLPLPEGDRVIGIQSWGIVPANMRYSTLEEFLRWREELESVDDLSAFARVRSNLITEDGRAEAVDGVEMSASGFRLAGVAPILGRPLVAADEAPGAPDVMVIGYGRWRSTFGGDSGVVGRTVKLGSSATTIVGVMPEGYGFPENHDLWVPLRANHTAALRRPGPVVKVFGRLAPGVTRERAQVELEILEAGVQTTELTGEPVRPRIVRYVGLFFAGDNDASVFIMLHALFPLLLVVVCANVATLVFARTAARSGEIAVRTALGASRRRIVFQMFAEGLVLAIFSSAFGLAAAAFGLRAFMAWAQAAGDVAPFWVDEGIALRTLLYVGVLTAFGGAIIGVVPALKATGRTVQNRLRHVSSGGSALQFGGMWTFVIVFQVAFTVAFLPLAATSLWEALRFEPAPVGLPADRYLVGFLSPEDRGYAEVAIASSQWGARARASYQEIERRLMAEPGVGSVTFARELPGMEHRRFRMEVDASKPSSTDLREVNVTWIAVDYFDDVEAPVIAGRFFRSSDHGANVVIVNESFVRNVLRGQNAVGRRVRYAGELGAETVAWQEIIGVVPDLGMSPEDPARAEGVYHPLLPGSPAWLAVRVRGGAESFAPRLRSLVAEVDPTLQVNDLQTLSAASERRRTGRWLRAALAGLVSCIALLLSAAGIFSLMSFTVTQRTREIGIRTALGAEPRQIVIAMFSRATMQLGIGLLAGCALAVLPGYPGERVTALLAIASFLLVIGLLACGIPVRRALRIQPTEAVREA